MADYKELVALANTLGWWGRGSSGDQKILKKGWRQEGAEGCKESNSKLHRMAPIRIPWRGLVAMSIACSNN